MDNKILIRGTGALANLFAARLAAAGLQVYMLGTWKDGIEKLSSHGVRLVEADGKEIVFSVTASHNPKAFENFQYALVLVKSWQTNLAARQISVCLSKDGLALSLQNGIGNLEKLSQIIGADRTAAGVTTTGATLLAPGLVRAGGDGIIYVNENHRLSKLIDWFEKAGFNVEIIKDINVLLWRKLIINAAINPLAALIRVPNGELINRKSAKELLISAIQETIKVAQAKGIQFQDFDPIDAALDTAQRTAANRSSMLQDVERGAPTEIDAICGEIVKAGEQTGIPTPINRTLWQLISALHKKPKRKISNRMN